MCKVDDRKPPHPERNCVVHPDTFRVGAAVDYRLAHRVQNGFVILRWIEVYPTRDSAHKLESDLLTHRIDRLVLRFVIGPHKEFREQAHQKKLNRDREHYDGDYRQRRQNERVTVSNLQNQTPKLRRPLK